MSEEKIDYADELENFFKKHNRVNYPIKNKNILQIVYDIFIKNILPNVDDIKDNTELLYYFGRYYQIVLKDKEKFIKLYLMSIEKGNGKASNGLGHHYMIEGDYENAIKYFLISMKTEDNKLVISLLGKCYEKIKDYDNMKNIIYLVYILKYIIVLFIWQGIFHDK